jgi:hypothetical protein
MRTALGALILAAAAIVAALLGRFGYLSGEAFGDGALKAISYAAIAALGLIGPALALNLFYSSHRFLVALVAILGCAALLATIGNSLGAIGHHVERVQVADARRDDEAAIARLEAERAALHFAPTTDTEATAARDAMLEADTARRAECDSRGRRCEELVAALAVKRDAYAALLKDRAATQQAERLDAEVADLRAKLEAKPAPAPAERPKTPPLEFLIKLPDTETVTQQNLAAVAGTELLIALALVIWEWRRLRPRTTDVIHDALRAMPASERTVSHAKREPAASGDLAIFVHDCMRRAGGENVELRALYSRFLEWCDAQQLAPLPPKKFSEAFVARCAEAQIDVRCEGQKVLFLDVRLAPTEHWH